MLEGVLSLLKAKHYLLLASDRRVQFFLVKILIFSSKQDANSMVMKEMSVYVTKDIIKLIQI